LARLSPDARPDARPYASPYVAGVGVGLVLLAAFVVMGRGLGASGAFSSVVTAGVGTLAPHHVAASPAYTDYAGSGTGGPLADWLVVELLGVGIGGFLSAAAAGRLARTVESGPRVGRTTRLMAALGGGVVMGVGAKLARGCTSGLGLTGGATLSVGAWIFIVAAFAAGFVVAPLVRRLWT
jgi:uncharacterized protein